MQIQLFGVPISPFVGKVQRALAWKRLDYELVEPKGPGDFRKWSPQTNKMPVLAIDGERIHDSTFILRRLEEVQSEPRLYAKAAAEAAQQRILEDWSDESLYWLRMAILWSDPRKAADTVLATLPTPAFLKPLLRIGVTRQLGGQVRAQGFGRFPKDVLVAELGARCDDLTTWLGERSFLCGGEPNAADIAVAAMLHFEGVDTPPEFAGALAARPALAAWKRRMDEATRSPGG